MLLRISGNATYQELAAPLSFATFWKRDYSHAPARQIVVLSFGF